VRPVCARDKSEVEWKHRAGGEDMAELEHPKFFVPLELVPAAPRRVDDDVNVALVVGERFDSIDRGHLSAANLAYQRCKWRTRSTSASTDVRKLLTVATAVKHVSLET